jgi:hypothetical protein
MNSVTDAGQANGWERLRVPRYKLKLFFGRIRRTANVEVAQVVQGSAIFVAHAPSEIRIIEMLVARGLGHILENA